MLSFFSIRGNSYEFSDIYVNREYPDGSCVAIYQTVVHNKVPPRTDRTRIEFFPSAYFLHQKGGEGEGTLITFCIQHNVIPYL
jgi:hypothetical protein